MCVVSNVFDHYDPIIPNPYVPAPTPASPNVGTLAWWPAIDVTELRTLIEDFKQAVAAAKIVDRLTKQPDCEDPDKAKLLDRVAELEKRIAVLESWRRG